MRNVNGIRVTTTTTTHDIPQPQFFLALSPSVLKTPRQPINTITGEAMTLDCKQSFLHRDNLILQTHRYHHKANPFSLALIIYLLIYL